MIGIGLDITRAGQTVSFSPENLRVGTRDVRDLTLRPNRMYSNPAGTTLIAGPGAEVAAMRDSRGVIVLKQTTFGARLKYAVQPAGGIRNRLLNNRGDGAVVGVLGSGGVLPADMLISGIAAGSIEVLTLAPKNGRPNTKVRINGTPTGNVNINFAGSQVIPAVAGQVWTSSVWSQMTAGSSTNLNSINLSTTTHAANGGFLTSFANNFFSTIGDDVRRSVVGTLVGGTIAFVSSSVQLTWTSGAIDITFDISAQQLEQAGAATDVQIVGADGLDVTEAGQRPINQLAWDAADDFMAFESNFAPTGAYLLAASRAPGSGFPSTVTFDGSPPGALFVQSIATQLSADGSGNSAFFEPAGWPSGLPGVRRLDMIRVNAAGDAQAWRNGVLATTGITLAGDMIPLAAINRLGRAGSSGRFSGGLLLDEGDTPLTESERLMTERYLAYNGGITL